MIVVLLPGPGPHGEQVYCCLQLVIYLQLVYHARSALSLVELSTAPSTRFALLKRDEVVSDSSAPSMTRSP